MIQISMKSWTDKKTGGDIKEKDVHNVHIVTYSHTKFLVPT